jgi:hypothetical protein
LAWGQLGPLPRSATMVRIGAPFADALEDHPDRLSTARTEYAANARSLP